MRKKLFLSFLITLIFFSLFFNTAYAQEPTPYTLLEPLPFITTTPDCQGASCTTNANLYISGLYRLGLGTASLLAVLMIIYGGFIRITTDSYSGQTQGRTIIQNALIGLFMALGSFIIVATIFETDDNGDIVINLDLPSRRESKPSGSGGTGKNDPGCRGDDCKYGNTVKYKDCNNCVEAKSFEHIKYSIKNGNPDGKTAQINNELGKKLNDAFKDSPYLLELTESWPPTVNHQNQGHYDGTSVDVNFRAKEKKIKPSAENIKEVFDVFKKHGLRAEFETGTQDIINSLRGTDVIVKEVAHSTGNHFSIYIK